MTTFVALTAALCLIPLVLSEDSHCRDVPGVSDFKLDSVIENLYDVVYYPDIPEFKNFSSGIRGFFNLNDTLYDIFVFDTTSNDKVELYYVVDKIDGAHIYETKLDDYDDSLTDDKISLKMYGYEKDKYLQMYVCGKGIAPETRFTFLSHDIDLDDEISKELLANDAKLGFKSPLVAANL